MVAVRMRADHKVEMLQAKCLQIGKGVPGGIGSAAINENILLRSADQNAVPLTDIDKMQFNASLRDRNLLF